VHVIPNGIDLARFTGRDREAAREAIKSELSVSGRFKLVGSVGSLVSLKGHEDLIRAAAIVTQTDPATHFVIIGDEPPGDQKTLRGLRELITSLGLSHRVHLMRRQLDVAEWLPALDLFVSASHSESFGLAIVEAMAAGCAVLATATEGASEVLEPDVDGRLTPVGDVPALSAAIAAMLADDELRAHLGKNAEAAAREQFDVARMVQQTEDVYRQALAGRA
jgi:glycosyltransferase involved in cell wall biosynthesis